MRRTQLVKLSSFAPSGYALLKRKPEFVTTTTCTVATLSQTL
uniref:Uncharacterized protein n=1 Tax=Anguilla anguilla TaxID=7936 RepID=A0A0E9WC54_ANGAN